MDNYFPGAFFTLVPINPNPVNKLFHLEQSRLRDQYDWSVPQIHLLKIDLEVETARDGIACIDI